jgi:hypothetical protein
MGQRPRGQLGGPGTRGGGSPRIGYEFQNVGEITNRGWEAQGSLARGGLSVIGAVSLVDSRVRRLATGYTGDLEPGDRMLQVSARTMSLTAAWSPSHWSGSGTAYRAEDWIYYDRLALARAFHADSEPSRNLVGRALRPYWLTYPGVTPAGDRVLVLRSPPRAHAERRQPPEPADGRAGQRDRAARSDALPAFARGVVKAAISDV